MIIEPDFVDHWKTKMLAGLLGDDELAPVYLIRLWAHCQNRKAWVFETMPAMALKGVCHFRGDAKEFEQALTTAGYIQRDGSSVRVLGWDEYNASLIANWENGKKGGRPSKNNNSAETHGLPKENPTETEKKPMGEPIREDKIREDKKEERNGGPGFDEFWSSYPRKVSKADALKAWGKLKVDADLLQKILSSVEASSKTEDWKKDNGKFIPYPASWLNSKRWEDEAPMQGAPSRNMPPKGLMIPPGATWMPGRGIVW